MKLIGHQVIWIVFLFFSHLGYSQVLEGRVLDKATQKPLPGATIYLDGTTVFAITDQDGNFRFESRGVNTALVVSFLGYITYNVENPQHYANKSMKILLDEDTMLLDEVVVSRGSFSNEDMMKAFRREFLGTSSSAKSCTILNEEDIVLHYDYSSFALLAESQNPIRVWNAHLEYEIHFNLEELRLNYGKKSLDPNDLMDSFFFGTSFYKDLSKSKKAGKKRQETYLGSIPHFMNTLASETWRSEGFFLFLNGHAENPKDYFKVSDTLGIKKVVLVREPMRPVRKQPAEALKRDGKTIYIDMGTTTGGAMEKTNFNILYQKDKQSVLEIKSKTLFVYPNGHFTPVYGVAFGGYMGSLKVGDMLPTDYQPDY